MQQNQNSQPISVSRDRKKTKHHRECWRCVRLRWVCLGVQVGYELLSERGKGGGHTNLIRQSIQKSGGIKSKTITKLLDRFMDRGLELWNHKENTTTTLIAPGTV